MSLAFHEPWLSRSFHEPGVGAACVVQVLTGNHSLQARCLSYVDVLDKQIPTLHLPVLGAMLTVFAVKRVAGSMLPAATDLIAELRQEGFIA